VIINTASNTVVNSITSGFNALRGVIDTMLKDVAPQLTHYTKQASFSLPIFYYSKEQRQPCMIQED
ncbi:MAG: hypothetical protein M1520_00955, partial [Candidatus Marsarchaeota archaeon]|nr:hypothetical protein [Candidatus Marsarchaeota archaeon]